MSLGRRGGHASSQLDQGLKIPAGEALLAANREWSEAFRLFWPLAKIPGTAANRFGPWGGGASRRSHQQIEILRHPGKLG